MVFHFRVGMFLDQHALTGSVQHHFHSAGDAQLVEDVKQVILHCVLADFQALGDFPIAKSLRQATDDVLLTLRQQIGSIRVDQSGGTA